MLFLYARSYRLILIRAYTHFLYNYDDSTTNGLNEIIKTELGVLYPNLLINLFLQLN